MDLGILTKLGDKLGVEARGYFIATVTFVLTVQFHYHEINENDFLKLRASLILIMIPLTLHDLYSYSFHLIRLHC